MGKSPGETFSLKKGVLKRKSQSFKVLCESAVRSTGLSNEKFYEKAQITRQQWYYFSWAIEPFPYWLKIKLCDTFGKPFRDLFLGEFGK